MVAGDGKAVAGASCDRFVPLAFRSIETQRSVLELGCERSSISPKRINKQLQMLLIAQASFEIAHRMFDTRRVQTDEMLHGQLDVDIGTID